LGIEKGENEDVECKHNANRPHPWEGVDDGDNGDLRHRRMSSKNVPEDTLDIGAKITERPNICYIQEVSLMIKR